MMREKLRDLMTKIPKTWRKHWYYFATVLIVFLVTVPIIWAQSNNLEVDGVAEKDVASEVMRPDKVEMLPQDLFSEGVNNKIGDEENVEVTPDEEQEVVEEGSVEATPVEQEEEWPAIELNWPVNSEKHLSQYGFGYSATYDDYRFNRGVHLGVSKGTPVKAAAGGKVVKVSEDLLYQKSVLIDHGSGVTSFYGNLGEVNVEMDQKVEASAVLGTVGERGQASWALDTNVYFEIRHNSNGVDPVEVIDEELNK
ncbi:murein DD-endopeptidase MepM/ murein hydrolase activator NlpD [Desulfitispora alkaliphila]|uniref:peptidoglycan DD-metalloendopeptidase family protein n=1 Tax=Desulfitispora alkaliphila TaxID=622674 RepID=UPI003D256B01